MKTKYFINLFVICIITLSLTSRKKQMRALYKNYYCNYDCNIEENARKCADSFLNKVLIKTIKRRRDKVIYYQSRLFYQNDSNYSFSFYNFCYGDTTHFTNGVEVVISKQHNNIYKIYNYQ